MNEDKIGPTVFHHDGENQATTTHRGEVLSEREVNYYWRDNKTVLYVLMGIWIFVTFGCGIIFGDWLDQFEFLGFPLGFWFTQQGAMFIYVALIFIYHFWMKRIEARHNVDDTPVIKASGGEHS